MNDEFRENTPFKPWGPLISPTYRNEPITKSDMIVASVVFALTLVNVIVALWQVSYQTKNSRSPMRSAYIWMIWLELSVSFVMALESYLHLLKIIKPSESMPTVVGRSYTDWFTGFGFYFSIRELIHQYTDDKALY
jgi:hypothetical protein